jgi:hypothetical protein
MTWKTAIVAAERLAALLAAIRTARGTVTNCKPRPDGVHVTWTLPS